MQLFISVFEKSWYFSIRFNPIYIILDSHWRKWQVAEKEQVTSMENRQTSWTATTATHETPLILTPHYFNTSVNEHHAFRRCTPKVESKPEILEDSLPQEMVSDFLYLSY